MQTDFTFPANYQIECDAELPGIGAAVQYFSQKQNPESLKVHALCRILPNDGAAWFAAFEEGYTPRAALSVALSTPDPETACVISAGSGFLFQPSLPGEWSLLPVFPVRGAFPILQRELILFSDFTRICALGRNGILWLSDQLCWDELNVTFIGERSVRLQGWGGEERHFELDILSGRLL